MTYYAIWQSVNGGEWRKTIACRVANKCNAEKMAERLQREHGENYKYQVRKVNRYAIPSELTETEAQ